MLPLFERGNCVQKSSVRNKFHEEGVAATKSQIKFDSVSVSNTLFLCFGGRFRLSGITRVTAGAIPEFRAARRASVPLSRIFFLFFIPASAGILSELEIER